MALQSEGGARMILQVEEGIRAVLEGKRDFVLAKNVHQAGEFVIDEKVHWI